MVSFRKILSLILIKLIHFRIPLIFFKISKSNLDFIIELTPKQTNPMLNLLNKEIPLTRIPLPVVNSLI